MARDCQVQVQARGDRAQVLDALGVELQLGEVGLAAFAGRVYPLFGACAQHIQALADFALEQVAPAVFVGEVPAGAQAHGADAVIAGGGQVRVVEVLGFAVEPGEGGGRLEGIVPGADPGVDHPHGIGVAAAIGVEYRRYIGVAVGVLGQDAEHGALAADRHFVLPFVEGHLVAFQRATIAQGNLVADVERVVQGDAAVGLPRAEVAAVAVVGTDEAFPAPAFGLHVQVGAGHRR
ncbi:hypothetical protein D9M71_452150 [compost metagenome]